MDFVLAFLGGYVIGSLPTAFLFVRRTKGIDIRTAGSGNVGAFNVFDVTGSKTGGIAVGVIDGLKGFLVSGICAWLLKVPFDVLVAAFLGTIIGHNYPVWLKFKGGRGLATAAGGLFAIGLAYTLVWCAVWVIIYRITRHIHSGNLAAILATPLILLALPVKWIETLMVISATGQSFQILAFVLSAVFLVSHWDAVQKLRFNRRHEHE